MATALKPMAIISTHERILNTIVKIILSEIEGLRYTPELDIQSKTFNLPQNHGDPCFNIYFQDVGEVKTNPATTMRFNIHYYIETSASDKVYERYSKLLRYCDQVNSLIQNQSSAQRLNIRKLRIVNQSPSVKDGSITLTSILNLVAFGRQGEYLV